jgi:hypothetical protein
MNELLMVYLTAALLLAVTGAALTALVRFAPALVADRPERWHRWAWLLLGLTLVLPVAWRLGGPERRGPAPIELWTGATSWSGGPTLPRLTIGGGRGAAHAGPVVRLERWAMGAGLALALGGMLLAALGLLRERRRLQALCAGLPLVKRVGRVRVCASDLAPGPFAARAGGLAYVVVPTALLADSSRLRLVISHEVHHHRRGDLATAIWLEGLRVLFFWNPALGWWKRSIVELQDLACDRHVLGRAVSAVEYGHCLLWAAEAAHQPRFRLEGARAMAAGSTTSLRRRMVAILARDGGRVRPWLSWAARAATLLVVAGSSWLAHGAVADRRVSAAEVGVMAARIEARSGFPVLVDEHVVEALNRMVASPEAREPMREALARMPRYRAFIEGVLRERGLPVELLALALHESRFDSEAHTNRPVERRSVGLWQLMPRVARTFGMEVSAERDERLDPWRSTEAAAALLAANRATLGDWPLAIAAYNGGVATIRTAVAGLSTQEARARILADSAEYGRYLASAMASVILIDNPGLLD